MSYREEPYAGKPHVRFREGGSIPGGDVIPLLAKSTSLEFIEEFLGGITLSGFLELIRKIKKSAEEHFLWWGLARNKLEIPGGVSAVMERVMKNNPRLCDIKEKIDPLKVEDTSSLNIKIIELMRKALESYTLHESYVRGFLEKIPNEVQNRENPFFTSLWEVLISEDDHMLGGFLKRWKKQDRLNPGDVIASIDCIAKLLQKVEDDEKEFVKVLYESVC